MPELRATGAAAAVDAILSGFDAYGARFRALTRQARRRFEHREWLEVKEDAAYRIALYSIQLGATLADVRAALGGRLADAAAWEEMKGDFANRIDGRADCELAETFFNSVSRRAFGIVGVDPRVEFLRSDAPPPAVDPSTFLATYEVREADETLVRRILSAVALDAPFADAEGDARAVARVLGERVERMRAAYGASVCVDVLTSAFYRNKGCYVVARLRTAGETVPLVLALLNETRGVVVDAVLLSPDEASVVFGFSWSYFLVEVGHPRAVVDFLASIMPHKRVDELYTSIGFNRHGKTELYRSLVRHLERPDARFEVAPGIEGLVMAVFTLPSLNVVFKIIKDTFGQPKQTTRQRVMDRYHFVFLRDRVGRLADAQEFEHLEFPRRCFDPALLGTLLAAAPSTVRLDGDRVLVRHVYTERRVTPLNLYLREASPEAAREAIVDYGNAIKELAAADIFTGDMLLKNFGVTRHGRVIFYDYDELVPLTECHIRRLPEAAHPDEEMAAEPWFHVGESDVFPEQFGSFLVPPPPLRDPFLAAHADLLTVDFWQGVQERLRAGEMFDFYPYPESRRLRR